jgi:queuine/archaeosine tRNA-ribosyltransferase
MIALVNDMRAAIIDGSFESKVSGWLDQWQGNAERKFNANGTN